MENVYIAPESKSDKTKVIIKNLAFSLILTVIAFVFYKVGDAVLDKIYEYFDLYGTPYIVKSLLSMLYSVTGFAILFAGGFLLTRKLKNAVLFTGIYSYVSLYINEIESEFSDLKTGIFSALYAKDIYPPSFIYNLSDFVISAVAVLLTFALVAVLYALFKNIDTDALILHKQKKWVKLRVLLVYFFGIGMFNIGRTLFLFLHSANVIDYYSLLRYFLTFVIAGVTIIGGLVITFICGFSIRKKVRDVIALVALIGFCCKLTAVTDSLLYNFYGPLVMSEVRSEQILGAICGMVGFCVPFVIFLFLFSKYLFPSEPKVGKAPVVGGAEENSPFVEQTGYYNGGDF